MIKNLSNIPARPGVYMFKGAGERIIYVGKAKNLRNRIRSYFQASTKLDHRKAAMVKMTRDFSYIVTENELEALILEANLIKQYKPKFNIILRDDKNYPYIKITTTEKWPRIEVVRKIERDNNLYFGPYIPSEAMWEALAFIRRNFLIRSCGYSLEKPIRPCIQHQMRRCLAPCAGLVSHEEYRKIVEEVILFLKGQKEELLHKLEDTMHKLSEDLRFEEAAKIRDKITRIRKAFEHQKITAPELEDMDIMGYYKYGNDIAINILFLRNGSLTGSKDFFLENVIAIDDADIMHSIIEFFYSKEIIIPDTIAVNKMPSDIKPLKKWLKEKRGKDINIEVPSEDKKRELLNMANDNARLHLFSKIKKQDHDNILLELKERFYLEKIPLSIGAFDISTIYGSESVGAFIFWENGDFKKEYYRHLKIKTVKGINDYAMMHEIISRVLKKGHLTPDLIIIDGGRGQLEIAKKVLEDLQIKTDIISIAKKPDRAFLPNNEIINLEDRSMPALLLKKIRDEVHRFAISFHRRLRDKRLKESLLQRIPGIGKKRRLELLRHFGSIDDIRKASVDEIAAIKGFNRKIAERVLSSLS